MKLASYESNDVVLQVIINNDDMSPELKAAITFDLQNAFSNIYNNVLRARNNIALQIMDVTGIKPVPEFIVGKLNAFDQPDKKDI